jgi:hypothetical protein
MRLIRSFAFLPNSERVQLETDDERMLLWALPSDLALTGRSEKPRP